MNTRTLTSPSVYTERPRELTRTYLADPKDPRATKTLQRFQLAESIMQLLASLGVLAILVGLLVTAAATFGHEPFEFSLLMLFIAALVPIRNTDEDITTLVRKLEDAKMRKFNVLPSSLLDEIAVPSDATSEQLWEAAGIMSRASDDDLAWARVEGRLPEAESSERYDASVRVGELRLEAAKVFA